MECRRAVGHRARVRRTDVLGELALERRDLGPLRHPARQDYAPNRLDLAFVENGFRDGNLLHCRLHDYTFLVCCLTRMAEARRAPLLSSA